MRAQLKKSLLLHVVAMKSRYYSTCTVYYNKYVYDYSLHYTYQVSRSKCEPHTLTFSLTLSHLEKEYFQVYVHVQLAIIIFYVEYYVRCADTHNAHFFPPYLLCSEPQLYIIKNEKHFLNEQRSRDALRKNS